MGGGFLLKKRRKKGNGRCLCGGGGKGRCFVKKKRRKENKEIDIGGYIYQGQTNGRKETRPVHPPHFPFLCVTTLS